MADGGGLVSQFDGGNVRRYEPWHLDPVVHAGIVDASGEILGRRREGERRHPPAIASPPNSQLPGIDIRSGDHIFRRADDVVELRRAPGGKPFRLAEVETVTRATA